MTDFELDPRLAADCEWVADLPLSRLLLMRDARYPWFILVPRRAGLRELCELSATDLDQFNRESRWLSHALLNIPGTQKLNIAALGNVVAQLHIHHIARHSADDAWPKPVWGLLPARPYSENEIKKRLAEIREALQNAELQA